MTTLYVFAKDFTLVESIGGSPFITDPEDQQLRSGVAEKMEQLVDEGAVTAIVSNQERCAPFMIAAKNAQVGQCIKAIDGQTGLISRIETLTPWHPDRPEIRFYLDLGDGFEARVNTTPDKEIEVAHKSIDSATDEMIIALGLTGIPMGMFCPCGPNTLGDSIFTLETDPARQYPRYPRSSDENMEGVDRPMTGYRMPNPGMLQLLDIIAKPTLETLWNRRVMVGNRPEDRAAAVAAGFEFVRYRHFFDWRIQ